MKINDLTVALRPRTAWEAVELGTALTRRHAVAIWTPWLALTVPVLVLVNAIAWSVDALWLAGLVMWWLKPLFDRIPLYVLSRAVFGDVPTFRQTLLAQGRWGLRWLLPYLTWRRLSLVRSLYLPIDLLEGGRGTAARERRSALGAPVYGVGMLVTTVCLHFEIILLWGIAGLVMLFVPGEYLVQVGMRAWQVLQNLPLWLELSGNLIAWVATSLIEPFYVGAGLGLYLNRRTEIEAWDIELALRRLGTRLAATATALTLTIAVGLIVGLAAIPFPVSAAPPQEQEQIDDAPAAEHGEEHIALEQIFGPTLADDGSLRKAVAQAYADPTVHPKRKVITWKAREKKPEKREWMPNAMSGPARLEGLGGVLALLGEYGLWALLAVLAVALAVTAPRWLRWFGNASAREGREASPVRLSDAEQAPAALPDDVPTAVRRLWREGRQREALALLYRASVEAMMARTQAVLVPGATESECLRASRKLVQAEDRDAFARAVRTWQYAAYAQRFPAEDELDGLLDELAQRFVWSAAGSGDVVV